MDKKLTCCKCDKKASYREKSGELLCQECHCGGKKVSYQTYTGNDSITSTTYIKCPHCGMECKEINDLEKEDKKDREQTDKYSKYLKELEQIDTNDITFKEYKKIKKLQEKVNILLKEKIESELLKTSIEIFLKKPLEELENNVPCQVVIKAKWIDENRDEFLVFQEMSGYIEDYCCEFAKEEAQLLTEIMQLEQNATNPQNQAELAAKKQQLTELENKQKELTQSLPITTQIAILEREIKELTNKPTRTATEEALLTSKKQELAELLAKQSNSNTNNAKPSDKTALYIELPDGGYAAWMRDISKITPDEYAEYLGEDNDDSLLREQWQTFLEIHKNSSSEGRITSKMGELSLEGDGDSESRELDAQSVQMNFNNLYQETLDEPNTNKNPEVGIEMLRPMIIHDFLLGTILMKDSIKDEHERGEKAKRAEELAENMIDTLNSRYRENYMSTDEYFFEQPRSLNERDSFLLKKQQEYQKEKRIALVKQDNFRKISHTTELENRVNSVVESIDHKIIQKTTEVLNLLREIRKGDFNKNYQLEITNSELQDLYRDKMILLGKMRDKKVKNDYSTNSDSKNKELECNTEGCGHKKNIRKDIIGQPRDFPHRMIRKKDGLVVYTQALCDKCLASAKDYAIISYVWDIACLPQLGKSDMGMRIEDLIPHVGGYYSNANLSYMTNVMYSETTLPDLVALEVNKLIVSNQISGILKELTEGSKKSFLTTLLNFEHVQTSELALTTMRLRIKHSNAKLNWSEVHVALTGRSSALEHDRIYGLLGLFPQTNIEINYSKDKFVVTEEFFRSLIRNGDITTTAFCGRNGKGLVNNNAKASLISNIIPIPCTFGFARKGSKYAEREVWDELLQLIENKVITILELAESLGIIEEVDKLPKSYVD
ncbi:3923_t:CDS:10 [Entrophospora sp. SA101]|nr:3923_t:CDS:10 [Entrophospora sp. SA101]